MEKLQPLIQNRFWILLGLGLILTGTGWWLSTAEMAAAIQTREAAIKTAEGKIPNGEVPNGDWTNALKRLNDLQEASVNSTRRALWENQRSRMWWNQALRPFVESIAYRGTLDVRALDAYRNYYIYDLQRVHQLANPYNPSDDTGNVVFPIEKLPQRIWGNQVPQSGEVWDAQEDLWLLEPILLAIRAVNGGENGTRSDSRIHVIDRIELAGGDRATLSPDAESPTGNYSSGGGDAQASFYGGQAAAAQGARSSNVEFTLKEEFGDAGGASGGGPGGSFSSPTSSNYRGASGGSDGDEEEPTGPRRYVDDDPNLPFRTRAFYLSVIMDHRQVPLLISELTSSDRSVYPMEIVRVQMQRINEDPVEGGGRTGAAITPSAFLASPGGAGVHTGAGSARTPASFSPPGSGTSSPPASGGVTAAAVGNIGASSGFEAALADPFEARVTLAGLITMYNPVAEPEATAATESDIPEPAVAEPVTGEPATTADPAASTNAEVSDTAAPTESVGAETPPTTDAPAALEPETGQPSAEAMSTDTPASQPPVTPPSGAPSPAPEPAATEPLGGEVPVSEPPTSETQASET